MHATADYLLFLAKLASVVIAILVLLAGILALTLRGKQKTKGELKVRKLNDRYQEMQDAVHHVATVKSAYKKILKKRKKEEKKSKGEKSRLFILKFNGDIKASSVENLTQEINAILLCADKKDEVLACVESAGGMVNAYGLAASQLQRLRDANIRLTIAIDKIAASGGYMMASVADYVIAAPFAIVGSVGVIAQLPNFHHLLKKKSIDFEQVTAGKYKRTLTVFGKNTEAGREKLQEEIDETLDLFKAHIKQNRPQVDVEKIATGEHWFATQALDLQLVDELKTSDDYLLSCHKNLELIEIQYEIKKKWGKRLAALSQDGAAYLLHGANNKQDLIH